jgi:malate synthase
MKVARRKNWAAAARQAAARKTKRKISKARQARRKASRRTVPKARRSAARKRKRATPRKAAPKAKPRTKAAVLAAVAGVVLRGRMGPRYADILTRDALAFLADLHRRFDGKRRALLAARAERQKRFDAGELPDFPRETKHIRDDDSWRVAPVPADLIDRRVEITGPVDRKMIVNALNSGATHYMADFEDANSPTWANNLEGQINLKDRWTGKIDFTDPQTKKRYAVGPNPAVLIVRPRGWHLPSDG